MLACSLGWSTCRAKQAKDGFKTQQARSRTCQTLGFQRAMRNIVTSNPWNWQQLLQQLLQLLGAQSINSHCFCQASIGPPWPEPKGFPCGFNGVWPRNWTPGEFQRFAWRKCTLNLIQTTLAIDLKSPEPRIAWNWMELGVASFQEIGKDMEGHLTIALCLKNSGFLTSSEISSINITKSCRVFQQSFALERLPRKS